MMLNNMEPMLIAVIAHSIIITVGVILAILTKRKED